MPETGIRVWWDDPATASHLPRGHHTMRARWLHAGADVFAAVTVTTPGAGTDTGHRGSPGR